MPKYKIEDIRLTARSKDERLDNVKKYPDSWIDDKIAHAFETAESGRQVFSTEDTIDLAPYINNGVEKFLYDTTEECHKISEIFITTSGTLYSEDVGYVANKSVSTYINNDNTISIDLETDALEGQDITLTIRYYFIPSIGFTEMFMSPEVYHYFRHCLYVQLYGALRDKENEIYHQQQVDRFIKEGSFGIENNWDEFIGLNANFTNIRSSSWG